MSLGSALRGESRRLRHHHTAAAVFGTGGLRWDRLLVIGLDIVLWLGAVVAAYYLARAGFASAFGGL